MPPDGTATRERILDAAERLVIENGFSATSVDSVIDESSSSKGAFFHHFATKEKLARALVKRYAAADVAHLHSALATVTAASDDPVEQAVAFVRVFEDTADELMGAQSSCLYVSILTERQLADAGTSEQIVEAIVAWRDGLAPILRTVLEARGNPEIDADDLADHLFVTFEGAFILCRSTGDSRHMRAQLRIVRQLLESVLA
jgi:TetR/AcrR family transcriptional repressor of nem operon